MKQDGQVRVLHLTSSLEMGGAERLLVDLLAQNAKEPGGAHVFYAVMNNRWDPTLRRELEESGAEGVFMNRKEGDKNPRHLAHLSRLVRQWGIQAVHTHTTGSKYWGYLLKAIHPGLRLFYTVHSTFDVVRYRGLALWLHRRLVDENVAVSKAVLAQCQERGLPRTALIYNGVDVEKYAFRAAAPRAGRPLRLVSVSRIQPAVKGQDLIVEAVALCHRQGFMVQVDLVGDVSGESAAPVEALRQRQKALCLPEDALRFLGLRTDVPALLPGYDGYLCASRKEAMGLSILEAMLAGLPVVAPDIGGPAELVRHGETGFLFAGGDAKSMAACIMDAFGGQRDIAAAVGAARQFALGFGIDRMAGQYATLYRSHWGAAKKGGALETAS